MGGDEVLEDSAQAVYMLEIPTDFGISNIVQDDPFDNGNAFFGSQKVLTELYRDDFGHMLMFGDRLDFLFGQIAQLNAVL
jgi:hypothetical protein